MTEESIADAKDPGLKETMNVYIKYTAEIMELKEEEETLNKSLVTLRDGLENSEKQKRKADAEFAKVKLELQKVNKELDEAKVKGLSEVERAQQGLDKRLNEARALEKSVEEDRKNFKDEEGITKKLQVRLTAKIKEAEASKVAFQLKRESLVLRESDLDDEKKRLDNVNIELKTKETGLESREGTVAQAETTYKEMEEKSKIAAKEAIAEKKSVNDEYRKNEQILSVIKKERGEHSKFYALAKEVKIFIIQHSFDENAIRKAIEDAFPALKGSETPPPE